MPNTNQPNPNDKPQNPKDPQKLKPIDYKDEAPPVVKANASGEGDDESAVRDPNEGEGNKTADRNYRAGVKKTIQKGNVEQDARKAADALDDDNEKKDLEDAEEAGRKGTIH